MFCHQPLLSVSYGSYVPCLCKALWEFWGVLCRHREGLSSQRPPRCCGGAGQEAHALHGGRVGLTMPADCALPSPGQRQPRRQGNHSAATAGTPAPWGWPGSGSLSVFFRACCPLHPRLLARGDPRPVERPRVPPPARDSRSLESHSPQAQCHTGVSASVRAAANCSHSAVRSRRVRQAAHLR